MMSFTADGQINEDQLRARDERMGVDTKQKRAARAGYLPPYPEGPLKGADQVGRGAVEYVEKH
jgi:hypothetical protein